MRADPDPVDIHVGARLRLRRKELGLSQHDVAQALGLTFQQVQKYEGGANRISASKLHGASMFLKVPVAFFFEGLPVPGQDDTAGAVLTQEITALWSTPGGRDVAKAYPSIASPITRKTVADLIRTLAGVD
jgi:transcriptional regulator with XRE-family HTH domain